MDVSRDAASSLATRLQDFRSQLSDDEQSALDGLLRSYQAMVRQASSESSGRGEAGKGVDRLNRLLSDVDDPNTPEIGPTITTVTITTTVASHPIITCN